MGNLLDKIIKNKYCLGCGICASIAGDDAIEMVEGPDGFIVPRLKNNKIDLAFLRDICPGITIRERSPLNDSESIFGHYDLLVSAYSTDEEVRLKGSSGGCITALLLFLLEKGIVEAILHIGKIKNSPLRSAAYLSTTREDVLLRAGSRYAPSVLLGNWMELLRTGKRIAVVGKPCDIAAVTQFLDVYPAYKNQVICKISFLCMGLPSQLATKVLIDSFGINEDDVQDFWYRGNGWPGKATAITNNGQRYELTYDQSWGTVLSKGVHFRCKICPVGFGDLADISCGDAWHIRDNKPNFEDKPGRSFAFIRNQVGRDIFEAAATNEYLKIDAFALEDLKVIQSSQYQRKIHVGIRIFALKILGDQLLKFTGFQFIKNLRRSNIRSIAKDFLGTLRRRLSI